ncbi:MAG TPA: aromatic ring-hydroxylating dioxygenase subunit alpha, partial [Caldimonas sp.]|nr:aromatic ring-hydroxylating dioxygenase subunit alpha [Caldimonas sp.]
GHASQLPQPGDYITNEIAGRPLIVVRHQDGSVRVLMNRCAHKGSRLVSAPCGNTGKLFRCPYHAWTYRTDGSLLSMPLKNGYEGTALHECEAGHGLATVKNVALYRGFIFVKLNDVGPAFEEYFGESLSSIDNLADRSPEGRLEIAGGCLRFMHQCNWKQYVENLNDTMHPMVVHESSAGTAKRMWLGQPADAPKPMAIEQFVPFMSDYKFFEDMGVRVFDNGHGFSGANFSIHSKYSAIPAYEKAMKEAYGEERTAEILGLVRHNTVYYPNLTIKGAIQSIRVARPVAVDKTIIESWTFRLVGAPPELLQRTTMYNRLINSPFSVVGHDDLNAYRGIQEGLHAGGNPWVSLHRNFCADEIGERDRTVIGTSEISMRNQYRAWARYMTLTM